MATRSPHKLREIREILGDAPAEFLSLADLGLPASPEEEGLERFDTFAENALAKARHFHGLTGLPTLADDSGLCVDALEGGPGVRTKRFAPPELTARWGRDEANNRFLLESLRRVPDEGRWAEYRCAIAAVTEEGEAVFEGRVRGRIGSEPRGRGGFGYDPVFVIPEYGRTLAELPPEVKARTSHRAAALRQLRPWLEGLAEGGREPAGGA